jgi:hypothetical protein
MSWEIEVSGPKMKLLNERRLGKGDRMSKLGASRKIIYVLKEVLGISLEDFIPLLSSFTIAHNEKKAVWHVSVCNRRSDTKVFHCFFMPIPLQLT